MSIRLIVLLIFTVSLNSINAEGTREVAPNSAILADGNLTTDIAALHLNNDSFNNFASYDNPDATTRMNVYISNPSSEQILLGFSSGHRNEGTSTPTPVFYEYRIKDPNGNIVFESDFILPTSTGPGIINSWEQGWSGPTQLGNTNGYNALEISSAQLSSQGWTGSGDYYIEFRAENDETILIDFWDVTVVDNSTTGNIEKKGRLWSNNWAFFAINDFGFPNRPFNGSFFVCAPDPADPEAAFITKIDFNGSGFRPAAFIIAFNSFGIENTGDIISDRRSFENDNKTVSEYPIFLNDPVDICKTAELGNLTFEGVSRCAAQDYCIKFSSTKAGQVDVLFDFDGQDDIFTPDTEDLLISINVDPSEINTPMCIDWNGLNGLGEPIQESASTQIPISISFAQGIYHFPIYDAELMTEGFDLQTVRPAGPKPMLYYDDTMISTPSGSGEPSLQLSGCDLPCHRWTNYSMPNTIGFGNLNTINSWWFSTQSITNEVFLLPAYYNCEITGEDVICTDTIGTLNLDLDLLPNGSVPLDIVDITWEGPGIVGNNTGEEISVGESGTYESTMTYLSAIGDTCSLSCQKQIEIITNSVTQIDTTINFGDEISINSIVYNSDGTYTQTLTASNGCDSIVTIIVNVLFTEIELFCDVIGPTGLCLGQRADLSVNISHTPAGVPMPDIISIAWSGPGIINSNIGDIITISLPGLYVANVSWIDQMGNTQLSNCSIDVLDNQNKFFQIDTNFFLGDTAIINGEVFTESGVSDQLFTTAEGCDSTVTIVVNVLEPLYECSISGDNNICDNESAELVINTLVIPPGSPIPPITDITWIGPGVNTNGNTIVAEQSGTYTATAMWTNAIGEIRTIECSHDINVNPSEEETITVFIIEGDSITINGEKYKEEGQYTQSLISSNGCDSLLTINVDEELAVISYGMEDCKSSDYSLLTATMGSPLSCGFISGSNIYRDNPSINAHSCTPGIDGGIAMCVSSLDSCDYVAGDERSIQFEININPLPGQEVTISGIDFWEKAPASFEWIAGQSGRNNFPTRYGLRVLKDDVEIFRQEDIMTSFLWSRENFSFLNNPNFTTSAVATYRFELLPYCLIGFDAPVTAWDIDEVNIRAACSEDSNRASIAGRLYQNNQSMTDVEVIMRYGTGDKQVTSTLTDTYGEYAFDYLPMNKAYQVTPHKDDDHLNGVSTLDIIHIQQHILGVSYFNTVDQMVAADINHSNSITAIDIIELRKLILGVRDDFPDNTSWRFSSTDRQLSMDYPWDLLEDVTMKLNDNENVMDFHGIKIGDVTGDVITKNSKDTDPIELTYKTEAIANGKQKIDFYCKEISNIIGLQMSILGLENVIEIESAIFNTKNSYYQDSGIFNLSINDINAVPVRSDQALFSIITESNNGTINPIGLGTYPSQVYIGEEIITRPIHIKSYQVRNTEESEIESTWTTSPNPFSEETNIRYRSVEDSRVSFSFYNTNGQLLYTKNSYQDSGIYNIKINKEQLQNASGVIYCIVRSQHNIESYKLLLIK